MLLDSFSHQDIKTWKQKYKKISQYLWEQYSYFAHCRSLIIDELKASLLSDCTTYEFSNWRRALDCKFNNEPLSAKGSILNEIGGRFNIGDIDQIKFPRFAGLYLAENTVTALREKYGTNSEPPKKYDHSLTPKELNLVESVSIVTVKGYLTKVLDLCNRNSLDEFLSKISLIKLPKSFTKKARQLGLDGYHIKNKKELLNALSDPNWRFMPMQFDIPANPQILGQLAYIAGIEAILYPSVKTKKKCLVAYPENFYQSKAYIELETEVATTVIYKRIDYGTFNNFI